ncbi:hypothetical protein WJX74_007742 [Apatococcus lobatus]|uniref:Condensation domain-containing protein n=1 Tax=Apatococcus lobatus TaxID=904363 RepID=A0AAW1QC11_9CHLO
MLLHLEVGVRLEGRVHEDALQAALDALTLRHEALRTHMLWKDPSSGLCQALVAPQPGLIKLQVFSGPQPQTGSESQVQQELPTFQASPVQAATNGRAGPSRPSNGSLEEPKIAESAASQTLAMNGQSKSHNGRDTLHISRPKANGTCKGSRPMQGRACSPQVPKQQQQQPQGTNSAFGAGQDRLNSSSENLNGHSPSSSDEEGGRDLNAAIVSGLCANGHTGSQTVGSKLQMAADSNQERTVNGHSNATPATSKAQQAAAAVRNFPANGNHGPVWSASQNMPENSCQQGDTSDRGAAGFKPTTAADTNDDSQSSIGGDDVDSSSKSGPQSGQEPALPNGQAEHGNGVVIAGDASRGPSSSLPSWVQEGL